MSATYPSAFEQYLLELVNRARLNPAAEKADVFGPNVQANIQSAIDYFGVNLASYRAQIDALSNDGIDRAPIAWNAQLSAAAEGHTKRLVEEEAQTHQFPGGPGLGQRARDAGYDYRSLGENVYSYSDDPRHAHAGFFIDWGYDAEDFNASGQLRADWRTVGDGIQDPAGHRVNIMNPGFTEVGIAVQRVTDPSSKVGPYVVTQDFGSRSGYQPQLLGVVIDDADGDDFYDLGEGLGGITVVATGSTGEFRTTTWGSGGYQMVLPAGSYTVTFSGAALDGEVVKSVRIAGANVKLDAEADEAGWARIRIGTAAGETLTASALAGVSVVAGGGGKDRLVDAGGDTILFGDGLDHGRLAQGAAIWRLYQATLDRNPDRQGYARWTDAMLNGDGTVKIAGSFVASKEFKQTYGALSNDAFVELMYENVLGRAPDPGGRQGWIDKLENGASRAQVVAGFSESAEFRRNTDAASEAYGDRRSPSDWSDEVYRLYKAVLARQPDGGGLEGWTDRLADGMSLGEVARRFVASTEFQNRYGSVDDEAFVELMYQNVLGRQPDAAGRETWLGRLEAGMSRADVVLGFAQSREFRDKQAEPMVDYFRGRGIDDVLVAKGGRDVYVGGTGADEFVFAKGIAGSGRIADFEDWDVLRLNGYGFADADAVRAAFVQAGEDIRLVLDDYTLTIAGRSVDSLDDQNIMLG